MRPWLVIVLAACGAPDPVAVEAVDGLEVDAAFETDDGPTVRLRVTAPADVEVTLVPPAAEGLDVEPTGEPRVERLGDAVVTTQRYRLLGKAGPYTVAAGCGAPAGADPVCADTLYVDIGEQPARGEMADIVDPPSTWPALPWGWIAGGAGGLAALVFAAWRLWPRRTEHVEVAPVAAEAPHVAAIRRWEALRDDPTLTEMQKAQGLSEVFRTYTEASLGFPATKWTTTETLAHLEGLDALPRMNVPRARRLLRATDRVKYAEARPGSHFFDDLEADLHAFVDQTRPRQWDGEAS